MMIRSRAFVCATLLVAALTVSCKKDGGHGGGGASGEKAASNALSVLPKDTTVLIGVDATRAHKASFLKPLIDKMTSEATGKAKDVKDKCGLDVTSALVNSVTIALVDPRNEKSGFAAISMAIDKNKAD